MGSTSPPFRHPVTRSEPTNEPIYVGPVGVPRTVFYNPGLVLRDWIGSEVMTLVQSNREGGSVLPPFSSFAVPVIVGPRNRMDRPFYDLHYN